VSLLECRGLTFRFNALVAVDNVNMAVEAGEIRAVIGPNGAGKSTLFNVINGILRASDGDTFFDGEKITGVPVYRVIQKGIARTFQLTHLFHDLTARENVRIAAQAQHTDRWRPIAGGHVFAASSRTADEALEQMHLSSFADTKAGLLSHGDQRLLEIAMAVAQKPRLLMLDEPTQGLSIEETDRAVRILRDMLAQGNLTVLLVEHDMEVVFNLAHKITVLHRGRVIADGTPAEVKANADVQSAYLGGLE
jgi:branched-chain amino acid transport system ATP-binding protein